MATILCKLYIVVAVFTILVVVLAYLCSRRKTVTVMLYDSIPVVDSSWNETNRFPHLPQTIVQSWKTRDLVPQRVFDDIKEFAPGYMHIFLDDEACDIFMQTHYPSLFDLYKRLKTPAHRADLFRYCYLYKHGGIWLDIKVVLVRPIKEIIRAGDEIYTVLSFAKWNNELTCHQGILAAPPGSSFMRDMISSFIMIEPHISHLGYLAFCRQMYIYLEKKYPGLRVGKTHSAGLPTLNLYEEFEVSECPTKRDHYGFCPYIRDTDGRIVFKVRDPTFPYNGSTDNSDDERLRILPTLSLT